MQGPLGLGGLAENANNELGRASSTAWADRALNTESRPTTPSFPQS